MTADTSDPAVRAAAALAQRQRRFGLSRALIATACSAVAVAAPFVATPLTGDSGAVVGAVVASLLLFAIAYVVWPWPWSDRELEHQRVDCIWRTIRADGDTDTSWDRFAAWAVAGPREVRLQLIHRKDQRRVPPSPYEVTTTQRLAVEDIAAAAEAMEQLRASAADKELDAQRRVEQAALAAREAEMQRRLDELDRQTALSIQQREEQARRELAAEEAAETAAQAEAVARALRKP